MILLFAIGALSLAAREEPVCGLDALVRLLGESKDTQLQVDILTGMRDGLQGVRTLAAPSGWESVEQQLSQSSNPVVRELTEGVSLKFGSPSVIGALRARMLEASASIDRRLQAMEALQAIRAPGMVKPLLKLLADAQLRGPAIRMLGSYNEPEIPDEILEVYARLTASEKRIALGTLVSRTASAHALLAAVEAGKVPARDLTADVISELRALNDSKVDLEIGQFWGVARVSEADKMLEIGKYRRLIGSGSPGDPVAGRGVYAQACQQCHTLFDSGGKVGPDLTGSSRGDLDYLLQNIIDPNSVIPNDYRAWTLETKDDRVVTGIIARQDEQSVTLITATETLVIPRKEIQDLEQGTLSLMPEGLLQAFSEQEVRNLMAYLQSGRQVPLPAERKGSASHE